VSTDPVLTALLVEDDARLAALTAEYLGGHGVVVTCAADGVTGLAEALRTSYDVVLLDLMLPGKDGRDVCRELRNHSDVPILVLTARGEEADRVLGLELGADDYVSKPFSARELVMRVKAVLRRTQPSPVPQETLAFDGLVLDPVAREAHLDDEPVRLTVKEFDLLYFLAANPRQVFSRSQLMASVWGYEAALDTGTLTVHIRRLRSKIERDPAQPRHLETVWGVGYRFAP